MYIFMHQNYDLSIVRLSKAQKINVVLCIIIITQASSKKHGEPQFPASAGETPGRRTQGGRKEGDHDDNYDNYDNYDADDVDEESGEGCIQGGGKEGERLKQDFGG